MSSLKSSPVDAGKNSLAGKYLTFLLGHESYGLPVLKVREIIHFITPTFVPQMPDYVRGVINLRGKVIPVIDLRTRFKLADSSTTERTCIMVVQLGSAAAKPLVGLVVDGVEEVAFVGGHDIEQTPDFGPSFDTTYILGMAKVRGRVKMLLDIDKVIASDAVINLSAELRPVTATAPATA